MQKQSWSLLCAFKVYLVGYPAGAGNSAGRLRHPPEDCTFSSPLHLATNSHRFEICLGGIELKSFLQQACMRRRLAVLVIAA